MRRSQLCVLAVFAFAACSSSSNTNGDASGDNGPGLTSVDSVTATIAEDTVLSGALATGSYSGYVTASVTTQGLIGTLTITGRTYTYTPLPNANGADHVEASLSDGTSAVTATIDVTITAVNDPPVIAVPLPVQVSAGNPFSFAGADAVAITDVDAGDAPLLVTVSADHGTLSLRSTDGLTLTVGDGVDDPTIKL